MNLKVKAGLCSTVLGIVYGVALMNGLDEWFRREEHPATDEPSSPENTSSGIADPESASSCTCPNKNQASREGLFASIQSNAPRLGVKTRYSHASDKTLDSGNRFADKSSAPNARTAHTEPNSENSPAESSASIDRNLFPTVRAEGNRLRSILVENLVAAQEEKQELQKDNPPLVEQCETFRSIENASSSEGRHLRHEDLQAISPQMTPVEKGSGKDPNLQTKTPGPLAESQRSDYQHVGLRNESEKDASSTSGKGRNRDMGNKNNRRRRHHRVRGEREKAKNEYFWRQRRERRSQRNQN